MSAWAAPDAPPPGPTDPIIGLLSERGLLPRGSSALVQTVRDKASDLVMSAMNFLGVPYRRGGNSVEQGGGCVERFRPDAERRAKPAAVQFVGQFLLGVGMQVEDHGPPVDG